MPVCQCILKSGPREGELCGALIESGRFCGRHIRCAERDSKLVSVQKRYYKDALRNVNLMDIDSLVAGYASDAFLEKDALIDVEDSSERWCIGRVVGIDQNNVLVHFEGWPARWDEWIDVTSERLEPFLSQTRLQAKVYHPRSNRNLTDYQITLRQQAERSNFEHLEKLGYTAEKLRSFIDDVSSYIERNDIIDILVYWKIFGAGVLDPTMVKRLKGL